jgi:D-glycero-alpha-D-manno-heptose-7-phosphate kinase
MSFVGGGSDLPGFYRQYGGAVVSTAIDKYIYVNVNRKFDNGIRVAYSQNEEVQHPKQLQHRLVKECLEHLGIEGGVEITTIADVPAKGTGLGSSSSFTVGLLHALSAFKGRYVSSEQLGRDASYIEIDVCGEPIGKQDQYAAAYGGINLIEFNPDDSVTVSRLICQPKTLRMLEQNIVVFYTGITRSASQILQHQSVALDSEKDKQEVMSRMVRLAYNLWDELRSDNVASFGEILHENWMLKKSLTAGISSNDIDDWYNVARSAGAIGGKILGAGAGGFLMFYAPQERHEAIGHALPNLKRVDMHFERRGSDIIFYQ